MPRIATGARLAILVCGGRGAGPACRVTPPLPGLVITASVRTAAAAVTPATTSTPGGCERRPLLRRASAPGPQRSDGSRRGARLTSSGGSPAAPRASVSAAELVSSFGVPCAARSNQLSSASACAMPAGSAGSGSSTSPTKLSRSLVTSLNRGRVPNPDKFVWRHRHAGSGCWSGGVVCPAAERSAGRRGRRLVSGRG